MNMCHFENQVDLKIVELHPKEVETFIDTEEYYVQCAPLRHSVTAIGYAFIEKDRLNISKAKLMKEGLKEGSWLRKIKEGKDVMVQGKKVLSKDITYTVHGKKSVYMTDTTVSRSLIPLAQGADILVVEATYTNELKEKAEKHKHLTAGEAATIANEADVKKLVLTHFSQRYKTVDDIKKDAQLNFKEVIMAHDFLKLKL